MFVLEVSIFLKNILSKFLLRIHLKQQNYEKEILRYYHHNFLFMKSFRIENLIVQSFVENYLIFKLKFFKLQLIFAIILVSSIQQSG